MSNEWPPGWSQPEPAVSWSGLVLLASLLGMTLIVIVALLGGTYAR